MRGLIAGPLLATWTRYQLSYCTRLESIGFAFESSFYTGSFVLLLINAIWDKLKSCKGQQIICTCELQNNQLYLPPLLDITLFTTACISGLLSGFSCQHEVIRVRSFSGISKEDDRSGLYGGSSLPLTLLITAITCIITN